jgi:hypothetical protein
MTDSHDNQDNPGITFPLPLSTCCRLSWGCFSTEGRTSPSCRAVWHAAWGGRSSEGGAARKVVQSNDARGRGAGAHRHARSQAENCRSVRLQQQPCLPLSGHDLRRDSRPEDSLWAVLFLPLVLVVIQREEIGREERYLERTFGEEYLAYKARVRRWA